MIRQLLLLPVLLISLAAAPASGPAVVKKPTTRLDATAAGVEAYQAMLAFDYTKARSILEPLYDDLPPAQRNRAFVLNHAIVDIVTKKFAMRGVKDLTEYLIKHREEDVPATDMLAIALNMTASNPQIKRGPLWQNAFREWDRRSYTLDHSRKGYRRWGTKWITDDDFKEIQARQDALKQAVLNQQERVSRAQLRLNTLMQEYQNAQDTKDTYRYLQWYTQTYNQNPITQLNWNTPFSPQQQDLAVDALNAYQAARRLGPEIALATQDMNSEMTELAKLRSEVVRPQWPSKFEPVDPTAPDADKPPKTATTQGDGVKTPFGVAPANDDQPAPGALRPLPPPGQRPAPGR